MEFEARYLRHRAGSVTVNDHVNVTATITIPEILYGLYLPRDVGAIFAHHE